MRVLAIIPLALTIIISIPACRGGSRDEPRGDPRIPDAREEWDEVLTWLPEDTESIMALNGPLRVSEFASLPTEARLLASFSVLLFNFRSSVVPIVAEFSIEFALTAGREFRSPLAIGSCSFEGASIVRLTRDAIPAGECWFSTLLDKADAKKKLAGTPVAVFHVKSDADDRTVWAARPREDIIITATDSEFLERIIRGIRGDAKRGRRALPADLPEWEHVDTTARSWGVRHYRRPPTGKDPTSPISAISGGSSLFWRSEPSAIGFVYSSAKADHPSIRAVYLSNSNDALAWVERAWMLKPHHPADVTWTARAIEPGIIEIRSEQTAPGSTYWLLLCATFGHAIF